MHIATIYNFLLAQTVPPWDQSDGATQPAVPAPPAGRQMSWSDFQKGLRTERNGEGSDSHYRNLLLAIVAGVIIVGVLLYLRQRRKEGGPPTSVGKLARELSRGIKFPLGARLLLWWVARSARLPVAALLISGELYEKSVAAWGQQPTFGMVRQWGMGKLTHLQGILFKVEPGGQQAVAGSK